MADGLKIYREMMVAFQAHLASLNLSYSGEEAKREMNSLANFAGWYPIDEIRDSYVEIIKEAFQHPHQDVLNETLYFPFGIARDAIARLEAYSFSLLIGLTPRYFYTSTLGLEEEHPRIARFLRDRLHRYPVELVEYGLSRTLDEPATSLESHFEFVEYAGEAILDWFNSLLKETIEENRLSDFKLFLDKMSGLFRGISWEIDGINQWRSYGRPAADDSPLALRASRVDLYHRFEQATDRLLIRSKAMRLGLVAWVLESSTTVDAPDDWVKACDNFGSTSTLLGILAESIDYRLQDSIGWDWWLLEPTEGEVVTIDFSSRLYKAFMVLALRRLARTDEIQVELPSSVERARELGRIAAENGPLREILEALRQDAASVESNLGVSADWIDDATVDRLGRLLDAIVEQWDEHWEATVLAADLDPTRVDLFQQELLDGYYQSGTVRHLLYQEDAWCQEEESEEVGEWRGFKRLLPKDYFIADSNVAIGHYASRMGESLATSQEIRSIEVLSQHVGAKRTVESQADFRDAVEEYVDLLREKYGTASVLIVDSWDMQRALSESPDFSWVVPKRREKSDVPEPRGYLGEAPVYSLRGESPMTIVASLGSYAEWTEYTPATVTREFTVLGDTVRFSLAPVEAELAEDLVRERPNEFRQTASDGTLEPANDAMQRLQKSVLLQVFMNTVTGIRKPDAAVGIEWLPATD